MIIQQLLETGDIQPSRLPNTTWYHCGPEFDRFSIAFLGGGENNHLLGHGIYLINSTHIAERYAKYVKSGKPFLYEVRIEGATNDNFYCSRNRPTDKQLDSYDAIAKLLGYEDVQSVKYRHSNMKFGRGLVGAVFERFGTQKGAKILIEHGIYGQFEEMGYDNVYEIAVWNTDTLKIVNKVKMPETEVAPVDPDLDQWWDDFINGKETQ